MSIYTSEEYKKDLKNAISATRKFEKLNHSSVLIAGASGLIGSYITDMLLYADKYLDANITVYAMGRSMERLKLRFDGVYANKIIYIEHDVNKILDFDYPVDYIIDAASNAFPAVFHADPVGTIMSNILGTKHLLDYGAVYGCKRFLYISSGEVYGQGDLSTDSFEETYAGYVNPIEVRSCYPNSKRAAETLCVSYTQQYGLDTVIVRPSHTYGPTATKEDNRANAQFVNMALAGKDIVMNSLGKQKRSYTYIADTASAIISILTSGESCCAYNVANERAVATIAEFAEEVAVQTGVEVKFVLAGETVKEEMTPIEKQVLDSRKLEMLGWKGQFTVKEGIRRILEVMKDIKNGEVMRI